MAFAIRLKELRENNLFSQKRLAEETGISSSAIARWELNQAQPNISAIITLANFFGVTVDYLLGISEY